MPPAYCDDDSKIAWAARITTSAPPVLAVGYTFVLGLLADRLSLPSGAFQGGSIILLPVGMIIAVIGWMRPLLGGLLALLVGIPVIMAITSATGWGAWYQPAYLVLCAAFIAGGVLHLVKAFLRLNHL